MKNHSLFLPHIQRPFVWEWEQVTRFLDSLMKNFPIQTFLFWKTRDYIKARKFMDDVIEDPDLSRFYDPNASELGREKVFVLDGQQRLQSLFSSFDGTFGGKDLYIDVCGGEGEVENGLAYGFALSDWRLNPPWFRIRSLTSDRRNAEDIADEVNGTLGQSSNESQVDRSARERRVRRNVAQLVSLLREDKHYWVEELDGVASEAYPYNVVLNIFIRVNSGGTKLDRGDLMFAAMKEPWAEVEENFESVVSELNSSGRLFFDKDFAIRCVMLVSGKGAVISPESFVGSAGKKNLDDLKAKWPDADRAFKQLKDFIYQDLKVYSDKVVRSYNAFIPIFEHFVSTPSPSPEDKELLKSYHYRSQMFNWYSSGTDKLLDAVHNILTRAGSGPFPLKDVVDYFGNQQKKTSLSESDLQDVRLRFIVLNLIYVQKMGHSPFDVAYKGNEPHIDHIYPRSMLKAQGTSEVNHLGNYRYVGALENQRKRAEKPDSYFSRLRSAGVDILRHLLVDKYAADPRLLVEGNYSVFRDERSRAIYKICSDVVNR
jgi:hypothetical protein